ncbi:MAG: hypothetical protein GX638_06245 [Crenarchaeota archaeon]|nr:hypothetical protein [Thermoproteota archaeon]
MVQKEIKNKTRIYGLVGILSAVLLVSMIYSFGGLPNIIDQNNLGDSQTNLPGVNAQANPLKIFSSYEEIQSFLQNNNQSRSTVEIAPSNVPSPNVDQSETLGGDYAVSKNEPGDNYYSTTNIQVAGVDEADSVKTDGVYLYVIANNTVYILDAGTTDIQNARVVAKIPSQNNTYISGIYLSEDGNNLAVIGNEYQYFTLEIKDLGDENQGIRTSQYSNGLTFIQIYDVSEKANPILSRNITTSGYYFNSRLIGNYLYTIITETVYLNSDGTVNLPVIFQNNQVSNVNPTKIFYVPQPDSYYTYTTVISININNSTQPADNASIMLGGASEMYVSAGNIYIISPTWDSESRYVTNIYKLAINEGVITAQAEGTVWGYPINQYAMDEYNGYFRIATTMWFEDNATTSDGAVFKVSRQLNSIYVLDANLNLVGKLEGFKKDESLYAVRFAGEKCYAVTFKQIDPFFVIDISNPAEPKVVGELKIPGYSSYLYPIDENHIIGIGQENNTAKISLFDVTDMTNPIEVAKYIVEGSYTSSEAAYDPHAFVYDVQRQLLIIPISVNNYRVVPLREGVVEESISIDSEQYWQGVYIFKVETTTGFTLQAKITQIDSTQTDEYYSNYNLRIERSIYINNTLYTISNSRVQLNSIDNFALLKTIDLN